MSGVLFLAVRMQKGFGVSVVVAEVARRLARLGVPVAVGCEDHDGSFDDLLIVRTAADSNRLAELCERQGCDTVVALTSPYFEALPELSGRFRCWAWEWGDPTPAFFDADAEERARIIERKRRTVYPAVAGVLVGSEYLRSEIGSGECPVLYAAADHAPDLGPKGLHWLLSRGTRKLRVGTLMRLGPGEARYKGNMLFTEIRRACDGAGIDCEFVVMGRGAEPDARELRKAGLEVWLNSPDEDKWDFLRGLDVFVSCSLWEGFNLPLAEAQALGTVGLAFDVGAHPEVTPFVMGGVADVVRQLRAYSRDPELLRTHSLAGYRFVRARFSWANTTSCLVELLNQAT